MPFVKEKIKSSFEYNIFNNIWMDLRTVQKAMIGLYKISVDESNGHLKFVTKLDKDQIKKF